MESSSSIEQPEEPAAVWTIDEVIEVACHLAGRDGLGAVHVAMSRRPTYDELVRSRRRAAADGLALQVNAAGVVVRPRGKGGSLADAWGRRVARRDATEADPPAEVGRAQRPTVGVRRLSVRRWLSAQAADWRADLTEMKEGTR